MIAARTSAPQHPAARGPRTRRRSCSRRFVRDGVASRARREAHAASSGPRRGKVAPRRRRRAAARARRRRRDPGRRGPRAERRGPRPRDGRRRATTRARRAGGRPPADHEPAHLSRRATSAWSGSSRTRPTPPARSWSRTRSSSDGSRLSALIMPWCTYTDPEIAHVGLYERDARGARHRDRHLRPGARGRGPRRHSTARRRASSRSTSGRATDQILGATIVARHAGEMIREVTLAMARELGLGGSPT